MDITITLTSHRITNNGTYTTIREWVTGDDNEAEMLINIYTKKVEESNPCDEWVRLEKTIGATTVLAVTPFDCYEEVKAI